MSRKLVVSVVGIVCCIVFLSVAVTYSVLQWSYSVSNTASIKSVGVMIYHNVPVTLGLQTLLLYLGVTVGRCFQWAVPLG